MGDPNVGNIGEVGKLVRKIEMGDPTIEKLVKRIETGVVHKQENNEDG